MKGQTWLLENRDALLALGRWNKRDKEADRVRDEIVRTSEIGDKRHVPCYDCAGRPEQGVTDRVPTCLECDSVGWVTRMVLECSACDGTGQEEFISPPRRRDQINPAWTKGRCQSCLGAGKVLAYYEDGTA